MAIPKLQIMLPRLPARFGRASGRRALLFAMILLAIVFQPAWAEEPF